MTLDQSALERMNKDEDFERLALYDHINCLEYFARYKESIDRLDLVLSAIVRTPHSKKVSPVEQTTRFMASYGLEVNTLMRHVDIFDVPVFYLICMWTKDKDIIWDLLEQKPDLTAKVILRDGQREEIVANNIEEFFSYFASADSPENMASSKEVLDNYKLKLLKDDLNRALNTPSGPANTIKI